jgi:DNA adenine methylase
MAHAISGAQLVMFDSARPSRVTPFNRGLLKWIGNKQRFAHEIASYFPLNFGTYHEPFLGSAAVLGTLAPRKAVGSDSFKPLIQIWQALREDPAEIKQWYAERWKRMVSGDKSEVYSQIKQSYNTRPNAPDLLFLCRSCYGGVVRFRQVDGYMSTPVGVHRPMPPQTFAARVDEWHRRTMGTEFHLTEFEEAMESARPGDLVYCDPPYSHSQTILYGAQSFSLPRLLGSIERCKQRNVYVALSIDGTKQSGKHSCELPIPVGLFEREVFISIGRSMLKRFQMDGQSLETEVVADRLLLTY